jgi:hypothetical protein
VGGKGGGGEDIHVLGVIPEIGGTPDPFTHPTSERVMPRDDFEEQIARVEVSIPGLSHRRVRTIGRGGWDHELQCVRVHVLVGRRWEGG